MLALWTSSGATTDKLVALPGGAGQSWELGELEAERASSSELFSLRRAGRVESHSQAV